MSLAGEYKPGDLPPPGYNDWHAWARVQCEAGLRQVRCWHCSEYKFPQELARTEQRSQTAYPTLRDARNETNPVEYIEPVPICLKCDGG